MGEDVVNSPDTGVAPTEASNRPNNARKRRRGNSVCYGFNRPGTPGATTGDVNTWNFKGRCDELKGHVYDCSNPRQAADEFTKTTKKVTEYTGTKYGAEVKLAIEKLQKPILPMPADSTARCLPQSRDHAGARPEEKAHSLVYRQCSDVLRAKLESIACQATIAGNADEIGLQKKISNLQLSFPSPKSMNHTPFTRRCDSSTRPTSTRMQPAKVTWSPSRTQLKFWNTAVETLEITLVLWSGLLQASSWQWRRHQRKV